MTLPRWFNRLLARVMPKKKRAPRRPPCPCGHLWHSHNRKGCKTCRAQWAVGAQSGPCNESGRAA